MKIVLSDRKIGKTAQLDIPKDNEVMLIGSKMGDVIEGTPAGLPGFKLKITGLSDSAGAPSRQEIDGPRKAKPLLSYGTGMRIREKGYRSRRLIRGNTISAETSQINTVIEEYGQKSPEALFKKAEKKE